jgi:hypothetical protein
MDNIWICKACVKYLTGHDEIEQFAIGGTEATCEECNTLLKRDQLYHVPRDWAARLKSKAPEA